MKTKQMMMAIVSKRDKMPKNQAKKVGQSNLRRPERVFALTSSGSEIVILTVSFSGNPSGPEIVNLTGSSLSLSSL